MISRCSGRVGATPNPQLPMTTLVTPCQLDGVRSPASLGLAPLIIDRIYGVLARFAGQGTSLIIAEQYVHRALALARTVYILSRGEVAHVGEASELDPGEIYEKYLGIESLS